ncbi:GerAB/ArcD/ProY family transporter [Caldisalinibacter kiritimatiensis]|uniref:Spore germination protein n=1 Tax=Caldisalinibacter kiritimatiensis TaxID=1304284 RepID=R1CC48_9FIRM|nr:endospore germination permease [Caldisalinibacter kiritimatiensis]EOC99879.1 hypothetical protein L21TH_2082 [Caldisalinibacter kiritimatiensis]
MKQALTNRQIAFILFGTIVGYGVIGLPKTAAERVGTEGWIPLLLATVVAVGITYIITYLGYVHENKTIFEYGQILVGKTLTYFIVLLYIIYFFVIFSMLTRISTEVVKLTILLKTPDWALVLIFYLIIYYAVTKGLLIIARINELYGIIIIIGILFIHLGIFTQGKLINIRPLFGGQPIQTYLNSTLYLIIPFLGMEVLTFIPINRKANKNIFKYISIIIGSIGILYILIVESCISVIGIEDIVHYKDAVMATVRRVNIKYLEFLQRLDGIFLITWIMSIFCTISVFAYGTAFLINSWFPKLNYKRVVFIILLLSFIILQIPNSINQVESIITYIGYLGAFVAIFIPILLLIITKVKGYDKKS